MLLLPTHDVTVLTRPEATRDRQNNRVVDWSDAEQATYRARVQALSSSETEGQGDQLVTELECYLPPAAVITAVDRAEVDGVTYKVQGKPKVQKGSGPLAQLDHILVVLREVTG
nr:head-tail adaptor protein [Streptomyces sp. NBC_00830]